jgi:pimeloyl-ACP methyl ester carboxylesterase
MEKFITSISGINIAYFIKNPSGPYTIFFIHGNYGSSKSWAKQLNSPLLEKYRLVALDLPAHGDSGNSPDAKRDYHIGGIALIVAAFINTLKNGPYVLCGFSLATNIIAEMIPIANDPSGIFLAGACLIGGGIGVDKIVMPTADISVLSKDEPEDEEIINFWNISSLSRDVEDKKQFLDQFKQVQPPYRSVFMNETLSGNLKDEIVLVRNFSRPVCWVFGKDEKIIDADYLDKLNVPKWKQKIFMINNANHFVFIDKPDEFNELLAEFTFDCFNNA